MSRPGLRDPRVARLVAFFEGLRPADLDRMGELYAPDAVFKDPFNEVRGLEAVRGIFRHMFDQLTDPRFTVLRALADGEQAFLVWHFEFVLRGGRSLRIEGGSLIVFDADGRVCLHRDYWDAAEELYAQLPLIGPVMRALRRRLAAR